MDKKILTTMLVGATLLATNLGSVNSFADVVSSTENQVSTHDRVATNSRTLIGIAKGTLEGMMTPYIEGVPGTGSLTLHYHSEDFGFVDGDEAALTIKLPKEFKYAASVPSFVSGISGKISVTGILGMGAEEKITAANCEIYADRLIIKAPSSFWIGSGGVDAHITIDYGQLLAQYPQLPIADAPAGYQVITQLKYAGAMWDIIHDPIIGTNDDTIYTDEHSAIL